MPHLPIWVPQSVRLGHALQLRRLLPVERSAGAGQQQPPHLVPVSAAHQALEDRGMLGIDGNDLCAVLPRRLHHQLARADKRLLVSKGDALFLLNCRQRRAQANHTDDCRYHRVGFFICSGGDQTIHAVQDADILATQLVFKVSRGFLRRHHGKLRMKCAALLRHALHIRSRRQRNDANLLHLLNHLERLPPDGAGRAENRKILRHLISPRTGAGESKSPQSARRSSCCQSGRECRRARGSDCRSP